ncbi:chitinase [Desmospora profundinema]|uniref:chitinase n=1 Tax=Desmospora profundinema TaxID=1571184 RepID=A0ABU1IR90_9BACL|nr:glycosyl hydrolase family 18 protein [Desmospora profundinema]MDR6227300.1 chitinase [Desmospora profundinema]
MGAKRTSPPRKMARKTVVFALVFTLLLGMIPLQVSAGATWQPGVAYSKGDRVTYQGSLYECLQAHTSQDGWEPDRVPALWKAVDGTPGEDREAPSRPTGLTVTAKTDTSVSLSWNPSRDNVGVTGYDIDRDDVRAGTTTGTSHRVTGLQPDTTYTFTVRAKDAAGNESEASEAVRVKTEPGGEIRNGKLLIGYWHNFDNGSGFIRLRDVSDHYDVIHVAFAEPVGGSTSGNIGFAPYNHSKEAMKADIAFLQSQGKKVLISIGGEKGQVQLTTTQARDRFVQSVISIIEEYGFDGMDIDLEGHSLYLNPGDTDINRPTTPVITNLISAIRQIHHHFGDSFVLTMAPETFFVQVGYTHYGGNGNGVDNRAGAYLPVIHQLRDILSWLQVQHYNSGPVMALDNEYYHMGNADFHVAMAEMVLQGFPVGRNPDHVFPPLRPEQVVIGLPASVNAGNGYTSTQEVHKALDYLIQGKSFGGRYQLRNSNGYSAFRGLMTWSINWDRFNGFEFSDHHRAYLDRLP